MPPPELPPLLTREECLEILRQAHVPQRHIDNLLEYLVHFHLPEAQFGNRSFILSMAQAFVCLSFTEQRHFISRIEPLLSAYIEARRRRGGVVTNITEQMQMIQAGIQAGREQSDWSLTAQALPTIDMHHQQGQAGRPLTETEFKEVFLLIAIPVVEQLLLTMGVNIRLQLLVVVSVLLLLLIGCDLFLPNYDINRAV